MPSRSYGQRTEILVFADDVSSVISAPCALVPVRPTIAFGWIGRKCVTCVPSGPDQYSRFAGGGDE